MSEKVPKSRVKRRIVHYRYWLLILLMFTIGIATSEWTGKGNFTEYIGNAATLTSLLLGLAAIFYSFLSNTTLSKSLGGVVTVSKEIGDVKDRIDENISESKKISDLSTSNLAEAKVISSRVHEYINTLSISIEGLAETSEKMSELLHKLPGRFDGLEKKISALESEAARKKNPVKGSQSEFSRERIDTFLKRSSVLELLYVCYAIFCMENKVIARQNEINEIFRKGAGEEGISYIRCMDGIGLLDIVSAECDKDDEAYTINKVNILLKSSCRGHLNEKVKSETNEILINLYSKWMQSLDDRIANS